MKSFVKHLTETTFATEQQRQNEVWDVEGRLKNGNQPFKFDVRPLKQVDNRLEKIGFFNTKSDKIVFETGNEWIIFDTLELHGYIKEKNKKDFNIQELLEELSWNLKIDK
jgi:hypothetical protein